MQRPEVEPECGADATGGTSCSGDTGDPLADSAMGSAGDEEEVSLMPPLWKGEAGVRGMAGVAGVDGGRRNALGPVVAAVAKQAAGEVARRKNVCRLATAARELDAAGCRKLIASEPLPMAEA